MQERDQIESAKSSIKHTHEKPIDPAAFLAALNMLEPAVSGDWAMHDEYTHK
jgi:hypothetical protein